MEGIGLALGVVVLAVQSACVAFVSWRLARRWWPDEVLAALCAALVIGTSSVILILEVVGTVGLLNRWAPALVAAIFALAVGRLVPAPGPSGLRERLQALPRPGSWSEWVLAGGLGASALVILGTVLSSIEGWRPRFDALGAHLPVMAQFVQREETWFLPYASPAAFNAHYPANTGLLGAWLVAPVSRELFVQQVATLGLILLVVATALLARTLGARPWLALAAGLALPASPRSIGELVGTSMQDLVSTGAVVVVFAFAARRWKRRGAHPTAELVVAGLAAGLAVGTRYGAALLVAPALVLLVLPTLLAVGSTRRLDIRNAAVHSLVVIGAMVLTGGYWYVRNQILTGSPVYPESVPWKEIVAHEQHTFPWISTYLQVGWAPSVWRRAVDFIWRYDGPLQLALVAWAGLAPVLALVRRERSLIGWVWALAPLSLVVVFVVTPAAPGFVIDGTVEATTQALNLRYGIAVVPVAAAVAVAALRSSRPEIQNALVGVALLVGAAVTVRKAYVEMPWSRSLPAAVAAVVLGAVVVRLLASTQQRHLVAAGAVGALALAAVAPPLANHFDDSRSTNGMRLEAERLALADVEGPVAVAGLCQIYGLYGPHLDREVEWLTGDDETDDRPFSTSQTEWLASMEAHGTVALVLGSDVCYSELGLPYHDWVAERPDVFREVWRTDERTAAFVVELPSAKGSN